MKKYFTNHNQQITSFFALIGTSILMTWCAVYLLLKPVNKSIESARAERTSNTIDFSTTEHYHWEPGEAAAGVYNLGLSVSEQERGWSPSDTLEFTLSASAVSGTNGRTYEHRLLQNQFTGGPNVQLPTKTVLYNISSGHFLGLVYVDNFETIRIDLNHIRSSKKMRGRLFLYPQHSGDGYDHYLRIAILIFGALSTLLIAFWSFRLWRGILRSR